MEAKVLDLWTNHRIWFWILLPIVLLPLILIFGGKLMSSVNSGKAHEELVNTQNADIELAKQQANQEGQAQHAQGEAQAIEQQVQDNRNSEGEIGTSCRERVCQYV